jgi:ribonuclease J
MQRVKEISLAAIEKAMAKKTRDFAAIKAHVRDDVAKFIFKETKRKPMILPIIMDI